MLLLRFTVNKTVLAWGPALLDLTSVEPLLCGIS